MLGDVVRGLQDIAVGYNVTMPYKTYICELLDGLSPAARLMGAVNTVVVKDGKSYGHNTDGAGFSVKLSPYKLDIRENLHCENEKLGNSGRPNSICAQQEMSRMNLRQHRLIRYYPIRTLRAILRL
mgnify:CR=1 FL=1